MEICDLKIGCSENSALGLQQWKRWQSCKIMKQEDIILPSGIT